MTRAHPDTEVNVYAVFEDGSRQYQVSEGEVVKVDFRGGPAPVGAAAEIDLDHFAFADLVLARTVFKDRVHVHLGIGVRPGHPSRPPGWGRKCNDSNQASP